jgi:hypothetical protein
MAQLLDRKGGVDSGPEQWCVQRLPWLPGQRLLDGAGCDAPPCGSRTPLSERDPATLRLGAASRGAAR